MLSKLVVPSGGCVSKSNGLKYEKDQEEKAGNNPSLPIAKSGSNNLSRVVDLMIWFENKTGTKAQPPKTNWHMGLYQCSILSTSSTLKGFVFFSKVKNQYTEYQ